MLFFAPSGNAQIYNYSYPSRQKITINGDLLGQCFSLATASYPGKTGLDKNKMNRSFNEGEFMDYLTIEPRSFDYKSGKEQELKRWILSNPDNSIDPFVLYQKSLELNNGNVWNTVLTIHQLLRSHARYYDHVRYINEGITEADSHNLFNKFIDIRGDLAERKDAFHGDHDGTWYRIWGVMLYRMLSEGNIDDLLGAKCILPQSTFGQKSLLDIIRTYRDARTSVEAVGAEWMKQMMGWPEKDKRKAEINLVGAKAAHSLLDTIERPDVYRAWRRDSLKVCRSRKYLQIQ